MSAYHETKTHGTPGFPYIVYPGILPEYINGIPHHWHEEMEIIYVTEGTVQVSVRQSDHVLSNGDIVLVHPQTIHAIRQYGESSARYYNILFRFSLLENGAELQLQQNNFPINYLSAKNGVCVYSTAHFRFSLEYSLISRPRAAMLLDG